MAKTFTDCPVEYTASLIANKWKIIILRELLGGTRRYNELTRNVVGISSKVLTENLRDLRKTGSYRGKYILKSRLKLSILLRKKATTLKM